MGIVLVLVLVLALVLAWLGYFVLAVKGGRRKEE